MPLFRPAAETSPETSSVDPLPPSSIPLPAPGGRRGRFVSRLEARGVHQRWVLFAGLAGMFANTFPFTILAVSLGTIGRELGARDTTMAWVITAPILFSALSLPVLGKLGDLYGHRRVFLLGSALATAVALCTAAAWSAGSLIGLRTLSGVVGAASGPSSMALIFSAYAPEERTRAMGWWSATGAGAPAIGLIAGGPLVELLGWRVLLLLQAGLGLVALIFAWLVLTETLRQRVRFDVLGALTLTLAVGALMLGLSQVRDLGFGSPLIQGSIVASLVGLGIFVRVEQRTAEPLLPLAFFRRRNFTWPIVAGSLQNSAYMGAFVLAPFVLTQVFSLSISRTALIMLLRTLTLALTSPLGGHLGERIGERGAAFLGTSVIAASMGVLALGTGAGSLVTFGAGLMLQGMGQGLCNPSLTSAVAGSVPQQNMGIAMASKQLISQVGTAFGIALLSTVYGGQIDGFQPAFLAGLGLAGLSVFAAFFVRRLAR